MTYFQNKIKFLEFPDGNYLDSLLAEILPASTYPQEVADAAAWLTRGGGEGEWNKGS